MAAACGEPGPATDDLTGTGLQERMGAGDRPTGGQAWILLVTRPMPPQFPASKRWLVRLAAGSSRRRREGSCRRTGGGRVGWLPALRGSGERSTPPDRKWPAGWRSPLVATPPPSTAAPGWLGQPPQRADRAGSVRFTRSTQLNVGPRRQLDDVVGPGRRRRADQQRRQDSQLRCRRHPPDSRGRAAGPSAAACNGSAPPRACSPSVRPANRGDGRGHPHLAFRDRRRRGGGFLDSWVVEVVAGSAGGVDPWWWDEFGKSVGA
jgi:hypothetical protein